MHGGRVRAADIFLPRGHADGAVEADILAVEVTVGDHGERQLGIFLRS